MAGSIREMSNEIGDNHGNFDLFRLDSSVRRKLINAPKSHEIKYAPIYTIRVTTRLA